MRAKSIKTNGYILYAVSGTNTISFAIDFREANTKGLLGFAVERINHSTGERKFVDGYKLFKSTMPKPEIDSSKPKENSKGIANTFTQPVQSFVWDDFACYDDTEYEYLFYPLKGTPQNIDRSLKPINVIIKTEKLFSGGEHDVFFNRGVASSQAYKRKFFNLSPDKITNPVMKKEALDWLSRQLDDAIIKFVTNAKSGETLLGCFYEFHYEPVLDAFKKAIDRGVKVKLIIDAKKNETTDKKGKFHESFPREENLRALKSVGISIAKSKGNVFLREAKTNAIQHNKFIVLQDKKGIGKEVWTGSTNISMGGIHGQTNVGHWVRNAMLSEQYVQYWKLLSTDPGALEIDDRTTALKKNNALKKKVEIIQENIIFSDWNDISEGITSVFSPRSGSDILETYVKMFDSAENMACITLAFGINELFKDYLEDNTNADHISFMLLEKEDKPNANTTKPFRPIGAKQNVYKSFGAYIEDDLYQWTKETSTIGLKLNSHVAYIHSKFLLVDPLSNDPVIVTGSANFSNASTNDNDENMIIIRGNKRVADIYFTEFNRLFNHYYFRSVYKNAKANNNTFEESFFLQENDKWLEKYVEGKFRFKRVEMFTKMEGF
jgi:phosphatidylserine/phosphatidylglycerophosphate/cardiolipin synthase-like enzyme